MVPDILQTAVLAGAVAAALAAQAAGDITISAPPMPIASPFEDIALPLPGPGNGKAGVCRNGEGGWTSRTIRPIVPAVSPADAPAIAFSS